MIPPLTALVGAPATQVRVIAAVPRVVTAQVAAATQAPVALLLRTPVALAVAAEIVTPRVHNTVGRLATLAEPERIAEIASSPVSPVAVAAFQTCVAPRRIPAFANRLCVPNPPG